MEMAMTLGKTLRRFVLVIIVAVCALLWTALGASLLLEWPRAWQISAAVAAALSTEGAFWAGAVLLGWKAFASRASIVRQLARVFNGKTKEAPDLKSG